MSAWTTLVETPPPTDQKHRLIIIIISDLFAVIGLDFYCNYWENVLAQEVFHFSTLLSQWFAHFACLGFLMKFSLFYTRTMSVIIIPVCQSVDRTYFHINNNYEKRTQRPNKNSSHLVCKSMEYYPYKIFHTICRRGDFKKMPGLKPVGKEWTHTLNLVSSHNLG